MEEVSYESYIRKKIKKDWELNNKTYYTKKNVKEINEDEINIPVDNWDILLT